MNNSSPLVSVLISTYNRSHLLKRAIQSVLSQDFENFELVIIDDCSSDDTPAVISAFNDDRIRHIRNSVNVGATAGDRGHIRRFVYELMQGQYFVYLCDDDCWSSTTLLRRQVEAFNQHQDVAMVVGGQLHYTMTTDNDSPPDVNKLPTVHYKDLYTTIWPGPLFFIKALYPKPFMTSEEFLSAFAENPACRNLIVGATLYSRKYFMTAATMANTTGSQWQAGYELLMGPACYGNVVYLDEPAVLVATQPSNASFQRTQLEHYLDSILSIQIAFEKPLSSQIPKQKKRFLKNIKRETIRNLTETFLLNTIAIHKTGEITLCSEDNIKKPVEATHALRQYLKNRIIPRKKDAKCLWKVLKIELARRLKSK